jgi:hypothetical protein
LFVATPAMHFSMLDCNISAADASSQASRPSCPPSPCALSWQPATPW